MNKTSDTFDKRTNKVFKGQYRRGCTGGRGVPRRVRPGNQ